MIIKTHISCIVDSCGQRLCGKHPPGECSKEKSMSLFDKLLNGGLQIPDSIYEAWLKKEPHHSFIVLITGATGTGKTTLALELAYRWAQKGHTDLQHGLLPLQTLYFSSESPGKTLLDSKINAFGWDKQNDKKFTVLERGDSVLGKVQDGTLLENEGWVALCGKDAFLAREAADPKKILESFLHNWYDIAALDDPEDMKNIRLADQPCLPALFVIDSLNVLPDVGSQGRVFMEIVSDFETKFRGGPLVLVIVLDASSEKPGRHFWEYVADMVLEIKRTNLYAGRNRAAYNIGTLEIRKARWQKTAFGVHQIKIFSKVDGDSLFRPPDMPNRTGDEKKARQISRLPYLLDGGIYIFQSIHRHLSEGIYRAVHGSANLEYVPTPLDQLNKLISGGDPKIQGGFPKGRCTAIVGVRGRMKSHLAYLWLLKNVKDGQEKCLLVSLRDDVPAACTRLTDIVKAERDSLGLTHNNAEKWIKDLQKERLRIIHFRPGYITPDEFLFNLWFHLEEFDPQYVVANAFEQLETMFPLCAAQPSFVSSVVDILCANEERTSLVIGVLPEGAPSAEMGYGLLPISDLVLRFNLEFVDKEILRPLPIWHEKYERYIESPENPLPSKIRETIVEVIRVPSGRPCGGKGLIYLDRNYKLQLDVPATLLQ